MFKPTKHKRNTQESSIFYLRGEEWRGSTSAAIHPPYSAVLFGCKPLLLIVGWSLVAWVGLVHSRLTDETHVSIKKNVFCSGAEVCKTDIGCVLFCYHHLLFPRSSLHHDKEHFVWSAFLEAWNTGIWPYSYTALQYCTQVFHLACYIFLLWNVSSKFW